MIGVRIKHFFLGAAGCTILFGSLLFSPPARSQAGQGGTLGWCAAVGSGGECSYHSSPMAACIDDWQTFNPEAQFMGTYSFDAWTVVGCSWCKYNSNGIGCYGVAAPTVAFFCQSGFHPAAYGRCVKDGEPDTPPPYCETGGGEKKPRTSYPISIQTGGKSFRYNDFRSTNGSLDLTRVFSNERSEGKGFRPESGLGFGWLFDFQYQMVLPSNFWMFAEFSIHRPDGVALNFKRGDDGSIFATGNGSTADGYNPGYTLKFLDTWPSALSDVPLTKTHWELKDPEGTTWALESFNSDYGNTGHPNYQSVRPVSRTNKSGQKTTFTYTNYGELTKIADDFNNNISIQWNYITMYDANNVNITYNKPTAIKSATLPDGSVITYQYVSLEAAAPNIPDRLAKMERRLPGGQLVDSQSYAAADSRFPLYISSITDNRGVVVNAVSYDERGRATQSSLAGGADSSSVTYGDPQSNGSVSRTVTNVLGKQTIYTFTKSGNNFLYASTNGLASASCAAGVTSQTLDSNGFALSETDEEGRKTTYVRDALGRPTSITRGAP